MKRYPIIKNGWKCIFIIKRYKNDKLKKRKTTVTMKNPSIYTK